MRRSLIALFSVVVLVSTIQAEDTKKPEPGLQDKLVGTWTLVSAKYNDEDFTFPEGITVIKHITPTHFVTIIYDKDGKVARAAGGTYVVEGGQYKETPQYGTSEIFDNIKGKVQAFDCKIEGKKWTHGGKLSNEMVIEEVYERAERK